MCKIEIIRMLNEYHIMALSDTEKQKTNLTQCVLVVDSTKWIIRSYIISVN